MKMLRFATAEDVVTVSIKDTKTHPEVVAADVVIGSRPTDVP